MVYADPSVTDIACAGLNGMRMGERTLTVRRATEVRRAAAPQPWLPLRVCAPHEDMCSSRPPGVMGTLRSGIPCYKLQVMRYSLC